MAGRGDGLRVDFPAEHTYARIMGGLRAVRREARITQDALAQVLPVRGRAISEWETLAIEPGFNNLLLLTGALGQSLVIRDEGVVMPGPGVARGPRESWLVFERRRLAHPLRLRREAWGMSQEALGELVGVSRDTINRWELSRVPPR